MIDVILSRGKLRLLPSKETWAWADLLTFAERINPKRAFLFVSKVLGRHIPVTPAEMRRAFTALAMQIPNDLPEPIVVIGMAETAVGLGTGVHQVLQQYYPSALFLATTRHPIHAPLITRFQEEHSHAPAHLLYGSVDETIQAQLACCKTLILVDDEASTGKTFINLTQALQTSHLKQLTHVITATLADWSPQLHFEGLQHHAVSLLAGTWQWTQDPTASLPNMPEVSTVAEGSWCIPKQQTWGRTPTTNPTCHAMILAEKSPAMNVSIGEKILVLGSNEFVWVPFLFAENLAKQGADVKFSATTRSPIMQGHAIETVISFKDHYGLGMINFVYNVKPNDYDRVILVIETSAESVDPQLFISIPNLELISTYDEPLPS